MQSQDIQPANNSHALDVILSYRFLLTILPTCSASASVAA